MPHDLKAWNEFMSPGGAGWFVTLVSELRDICTRFGPLISDHQVALDLCTFPAWSDFAMLPARIQRRWIRLAKIELDHLLVEEDIRMIFEAREMGKARWLLEPFSKNMALRDELTQAEKRIWIERARLAACGKFDDNALDRARTIRIELACAAMPNCLTGIYFLTTDQSDVKIGYASDVASRARTLQTGNARPLLLLLAIAGTQSDERALHQRFAAYRIHNEWFRLSAEISAFIQQQKVRP